MNSLKKIAAAVLAAAMLAMFAACSQQASSGGAGGSSAESAPESTAEASSAASSEKTPVPTDPDEILTKAREAATTINSYSAIVETDMNMSVSGQDVETATKSKMTVFTDPLKMKMTGETQMADQAIPTEVYAQQDGDTLNMYIQTNGQWYVQQVDAATLNSAGMNTGAEAANYLKAMETPTIEGEEVMNGSNCVKLSGMVSGSNPDAREVLQNNASFAQMQQMGADTTAALDNFQMPVTFWVNTETYYVVRMESTATESMNTLIGELLPGSGVTLFHMTYDFININNAIDFTIPTAATETTGEAAA